MFKKRGVGGVILGIVAVCALRFFIHFLSGVVLWANFEEFMAFGREWVGRPVLYSICYNGIYMLPETVLTVVAAVILFRVPQFHRVLGLPAKA